MLKISTMTYTLGANCPGVSPRDYPRLAAEAGVHGLNWVGVTGMTPEDARQMTLDAGLEVSCFTIPPTAFARGERDEAVLEELRLQYDEAARLGASRVMVVPLPVFAWDDRLRSQKHWLELLPAVAALARQFGLIPTIENYRGAESPFVMERDLLLAVSAVPELRVTFDIGNTATAEDPLACAKKLEGKIEYVHLTDWRIHQEKGEDMVLGLTGEYYEPAPLGEGDIDLKAVLAELVRQQYEGYADIEYAGSEYPFQAVARGAQWMRSTGFAE